MHRPQRTPTPFDRWIPVPGAEPIRNSPFDLYRSFGVSGSVRSNIDELAEPVYGSTRHRSQDAGAYPNDQHDNAYDAFESILQQARATEIDSAFTRISLKPVESLIKCSADHLLVCRFLDVCDASTDDKFKPPRQYFCPLSLEAMRDPVVCSDGNTYEKAHIQRHIAMSGAKSPLTRENLTCSFVFPCNALRTLMAEWAQDAAKRVCGDIPCGEMRLKLATARIKNDCL